MKLKKLLVTALLGLSACCLVFGATSCNESHEHNFSEWETVAEPTCTSFGIQKRVCGCGQVEYDTKDALAHKLVVDASVDATCSAFGKTEGSHCSDCGAIIVAQTETPKLAHKFSAWENVAPTTCTAFGLQKRACECGQVEYNVEEAFAHNVVIDDAVDATCTEFGKTEGSHCDACGVTIVAQEIIAPIGHNCDQISVLDEAYCNHDGVKKFSCSNSDCSYYYEEVYSIPELNSSEIYANAVQYTGLLEVRNKLGGIMDLASAFVISSDGVIVTSNLLTDNAYSATFMLNDVYYDVTEVLAYSTTSCIAVLKIDATDLPYATLCKREPVNAETVYTVGSPNGLVASISSGVISNAKRVMADANYIQHDADMSVGYVGGPLINRYGEVIGINVGYVADVNVSAWAAELDLLDYSTSISMEEYGNRTYTPLEELARWVQSNGNASTDETIEYVFAGEVEGDQFFYTIGYNTEEGYLFAEGRWVQKTVNILTAKVRFNNLSGTYQYDVSLTDGVFTNETNGYIDAATYDHSTMLTYDTYHGRYWNEAQVMELYSGAVKDTLEWFDAYLDMYFEHITLKTFGFEVLSYDRDVEALPKLNQFVMENGMLDTDTGAYVLSGGTQYGEDVMKFSISYMPKTESMSETTKVSVEYYLAEGELFAVSLTLNPTDNGNRFEGMYAVYNGTEYVTQNTCWGYLEANTFTKFTQLSCYEFFGLEDYEDVILEDYKSLLGYILGLLGKNVMPSVSPELTIADLGFLFYFG